MPFYICPKCKNPFTVHRPKAEATKPGVKPVVPLPGQAGAKPAAQNAGAPKAALKPKTGADIVFSPSGTDSQLHVLFLARALQGPRLTTIVVGSDQTGSGTAHTARGHHFAAWTASGRPACEGGPVAGLSGDCVALPLHDGGADIAARADFDQAVLDAVETAVADGAAVLLHIMDSSKLGWRAPSDACLGDIARRNAVEL